MALDQEAGLSEEDHTTGSLDRTPQGPAPSADETTTNRVGSFAEKTLPPIPLVSPISGMDQQYFNKDTPDTPYEGDVEIMPTTNVDRVPAIDGLPKLSSASGSVGLPASSSNATILGVHPHRQSQPVSEAADGTTAQPMPIPPSPTVAQSPVRKKSSMTFPRGLRINIGSGGENPSLMPPGSLSTQATSRSVPIPEASPINGSLISPLPEPQPSEVLHRPFHILRIIHGSMDDSSPGTYLTGSIHISSAIWRPPSWTIAAGPGNTNKGSSAKSALAPPKIVAQDIKFRFIQQLLLHLAIIKSTASAVLLDGVREYRRGEISTASVTNGNGTGGSEGINRIVRVAQEFETALDALEEEMEGCYKLLVKGGVGVSAWKGKGKKMGGGGGGWSSQIKSKVGGMTKEKV